MKAASGQSPAFENGTPIRVPVENRRNQISDSRSSQREQHNDDNVGGSVNERVVYPPQKPAITNCRVNSPIGILPVGAVAVANTMMMNDPTTFTTAVASRSPPFMP
jgi:hypothetical protein